MRRKSIDGSVLDYLLDRLTVPNPRLKPPVPYLVPTPVETPELLKVGTRVALVSRVYGTTEVGTLEHDAWTGGSDSLVTIRTDDGARYRTEGRIYHIEED